MGIFFLGSTATLAKIEPVHAQGLSAAQIKEFLREVLKAFSEQAGESLKSFNSSLTYGSELSKPRLNRRRPTDLVGVPELYVRSDSEKSHEDAESFVEYREKTEVLAELETFVDQGAGDETEALEYDEDIAAWAEAVRGWLKLAGICGGQPTSAEHWVGDRPVLA
ncbi:MAG: hypothetical protein MH252_01425 [Thermosynechococcaceae cyanobacterium MS004]|nr:hypothetical protein [Thermosynechococcaceae cyanobacterium MS004]